MAMRRWILCLVKKNSNPGDIFLHRNIGVVDSLDDLFTTKHFGVKTAKLNPSAWIRDEFDFWIRSKGSRLFWGSGG